jgi:hypothetical protein
MPPVGVCSDDHKFKRSKIKMMTILYSINYCSVCGPVFRLLL